MEFNQVINNRRSIRNFKNENINTKIIEELIYNATLSPSAHNAQPWNYYVFTGEKKETLTQLINEYITNTSDLTYYQKIMRKNILFIEQAPVVILCYMNKENCKEQDILSMGASIENLVLSAENRNLGALWNGVIVDFESEINKKFNINNKKLVSGVIIGYKNEFPDRRPRKNIKDVVTFL